MRATASSARVALNARRLLLVWVATAFVLIAMSERQRSRYYLPLCPPIALLAALWYVADAASEGRSVVLSMLVTGLVFVGVIALGQLTSYLGHKRKSAKRRPL